MTSASFASDQASHQHSLQTLHALYEYDDFMQSITSMVDLGCGAGLDLEWWATRTTRDPQPLPLNIRCVGVDRLDDLPVAHRYRNITYQRQDFESDIIHTHKRKFDVLWCHDSFQFVLDPFLVLRQWRQVMNPDAMLCLILPQTTNLEYNTQDFIQRDFCYHHWTLVSLIHVLAVSGFDCAGGFFRKNPDDAWLHAVVYNSEHQAMDPRRTSWYELADRALLPESAASSIQRWGYLRQRDLMLPWLDKSLMSYHNH